MNRFVAIEILPDHIDIVLMRGDRATGSRRLPVELAMDAGPWCKGLHAAQELFARAVKELGALKASAVVLYRSPTQAVDLASVEVRSAEQAEEAASLDCLGGLSYSMDNAAVAARMVARDLAGESRKTHVVVAADRHDVLSAIAALIEGAGLKLQFVTPIDAAITALITSQGMHKAGPLQSWLYIGQQSSFFLIVGEGRVHFGRSLSLGLDTLARTLTRSIRVRGREEPIELDFETAASIIHRVGVPRGEQVVYEPLGLTGTQLRPIVQPVLQRYVVELRQSMRFALPDVDLNGVPMVLLGPGASLAGFDELLEIELGIRPQRAAGEMLHDRATPGAPGSELHDALQDHAVLKGLTVLPPELEGKRRTAELRRCLWAGSAAALLFVAVDAVRLSDQVSQASQHAESLVGQASEDQALETTRLKLTNASAALQVLEDDIQHELATCVSFRAAMQEVAKLTPESVRLTNMTFSTREGQSVCALRGYAVKSSRSAAAGSAGSESELKSFIEHLQASPLVEKVVLLNVERGELGGNAAESFQASIDLVSIPPGTRPAQVVSATAPEASE